MKQNLKVPLVIAGVFVISTVVLYSCGGGGYGGGSAMMAVPMSVSTVQAVACPASGTTDVTIVNMTVGFSPSNVTVPINSIVKWTNTDSTTHTVTSTMVPMSGTFDVQVNPAASTCFRFTSVGTFNYHCSIHPMMPTGMVVVQ